MNPCKWKEDRTLPRQHQATPRIPTFFLFFFAYWLHDRIPREWAGVGRAAASWGSKKWALSPRIMPLFQLLWSGMPDFTGRYSSLCVNQSFARDPLGPAPHPPQPTHTPDPHDPTRSSDPPQTRSYKLIPGSNPLLQSSPTPSSWRISGRTFVHVEAR